MYALLGGVNSETMGLHLQSASPSILPERKCERETRPAHLVALESSEFTYQPMTYSLVFTLEGEGKDDIVEKYQALAPWLLSARELRLWYNLDKFYIGAIEGRTKFSMVSRKVGRLEVDFVCNPPCWHLVRSKTLGWEPVSSIPIPEQITSETETVSCEDPLDTLPEVEYTAAHPAALYFAITGEWTNLSIGGASGLVIPWETPQNMTVYIDCDTQIVYHKLGGVMTSIPYSGDFPQLTKDTSGAIPVTATDFDGVIRLLVIERG